MDTLNFTDAYPPKIGFSGDEMLFLPQGYKGQPCFLKKGSRKEILDEALIYEWLQGKLPVPKVYLKGYDGNCYYSVVSFEKGEMMQEAFLSSSKQEVIVAFAKLLSTIHAVSYEGLPVNHDLASKIKKVQGILARNEVKTQYFEPELKHLSPSELYARLTHLQGFEEDLVLTHGDVCFPNFLYHNQTLSCVLDVGGMGVNDRHLDLAIGLRTLRYNVGELTSQDLSLFIETYGIKALDKKKIEFYIYLDELTNG